MPRRPTGSSDTLEQVLAARRAENMRLEEEVRNLGGRYYDAVHRIELAEAEVAKERGARRDAVQAMVGAGWKRDFIAQVTGLSPKSIDEMLRTNGIRRAGADKGNAVQTAVADQPNLG